MISVFCFSFGNQIMKLNISWNFCAYSARNLCSLMNPQQCQSENSCNNMMMFYFLGPRAPLNITVIEQGVLFAFVSWTAPNDPNKDRYRYRVTWSQNEQSSSTTVYSTEHNMTSLVPGKNYTVTVTSSYISTISQPATTTFTAGTVQSKPTARNIHEVTPWSDIRYVSHTFLWFVQKYPWNILIYLFHPFWSICIYSLCWQSFNRTQPPLWYRTWRKDEISMKEKYLIKLFSYIDWSWLHWRIQI